MFPKYNYSPSHTQISNAEAFGVLSKDQKSWIYNLGQVWCEHYGYDRDRKFDVLPDYHPHYRKAGVPEKDRACVCQIDYERESISIAMCICFNYLKAMAVHRKLLIASPESNEEGWYFLSLAHKKFCQVVWNAGKYGSRWDSLDSPPDYPPLSDTRLVENHYKTLFPDTVLIT